MNLTDLPFNIETIDQTMTLQPGPSQRRTRAAAAWYDAARGDRPAGAKAALDPKAIKAFIDQLWLVERRDDGCMYMRLVSSSVYDLTGEEMTGLYIDPDKKYGKWVAIYEKAQGHQAPLTLHNRISEHDKDYLTSEVIVLPLHDAQDRIRYCLCVYDILAL